MDMRGREYYGQLQITGNRKPINKHGSIYRLIMEFTRDLTEQSIRPNADGREIIIIIRENPFNSEEKESLDSSIKVNELEHFAESNAKDDIPIEGESQVDFYNRLINNGLPPASAEFLMADWFGLAKDPELVEWLNDSKAVRFRELNSRQEAFESAAPTEYEILKTYVIDKFPNMTQNLTFRKA